MRVRVEGEGVLRQREHVLRFDQVDDPRDPRGQRWELGVLLGSAVLGLTLLAPSLRRVEQLDGRLQQLRDWFRDAIVSPPIQGGDAQDDFAPA